MKIAVIGGGPAGLMASAQAGLGGEVVLFERNEKLGKKLYITGKGRCNVTNMCSPREFLEKVVSNPRFLYGSIFAFTPENTVDLIESMGVKTKVERGNRVFPASDKASDITKALVKYAEYNGVNFVYENVLSVSCEENGFVIATKKNEYRFDKVILACGGVSYPSTGSNGDGFNFASRLGHTIVPLAPALVPIYLSEDVTSLSGLSLKNVTVTVKGGQKEYSQFGEMLFTGVGVSGPIVLSISSLINREDVKKLQLSVDLKPALDRETLDKRILSDFSKVKNKQLKNSLDFLLPKSLIPYIIKESGINPEKPINSITRVEREKLVSLLKDLRFSIASLGEVEIGVVTAGGVSVKEVNPKTMESKICPGLYFAGEMLDIDAFTGGFNIQIALSTGYLAGQSAGGLND